MVTDALPAIGHTYEARFSDLAFHLKFDPDERTMQFTLASAPDFNTSECVTYRALAQRPGLFLVTWTEADATTVTHVEDFDQGLFHTNITKPDHTFLNLSGSWMRLS